MDMSNTPRRPQTMLNDFRYPMPKSDKPVDGNKYPARATWECGLNGNIYLNSGTEWPKLCLLYFDERCSSLPDKRR